MSANQCEAVNLKQKLTLFEGKFSHRIVGEVNDMFVKVVKCEDEFIWHSHEWEDELFYVVTGHLRMLFRDKEVDVRPGEFLVVPHGVEHKPTFTEETHIMLIEPKATVNTGDADESDLTHEATQWI